MKYITTLLVITLCLSFLGFGCSANNATLGPTKIEREKDLITGRIKQKAVFIDEKNVSFKASNWGIGGRTSAIDLATAEAIRKDSENQTAREQMNNKVLEDYMNNPKKYGNEKILKKAGILPTLSGIYEILVFNNSGRPLYVAISGNSEGHLLRNKGSQSFSIDTKKFSVHAYKVNGAPFKQKKFRIPSPTPKIPAFRSKKLYAALITITPKR